MEPIPLTRAGPEEGGNYEYHWTGSFIEAHFLSDVGKKRKKNEDSCIMCVPEDETLANERGLLFAVADGMGGAKAGEFASRLTLEILIDGYYNGRANNIPKALAKALDLANTRVYDESQSNPEYEGMGTTVSAVVIHGDSAYVGQVGDSRVYVRRDQASVLQITDDHSLVAEQVRHGYISEDEARNHSLKNLITRAIGIKRSVEVDLFAFQLKHNDTVLICSDGLSNLVSDEEINETLKNYDIQAASRLLVGRALEEGGHDNITTALVRITQPPEERDFEPGAIEVTMPKPGIFRKLRRFLP